MKRILIISVVFVVVFPMLAWADFDIKKWRYEKDIGAPLDLREAAYVELVFDNEVYENAAPGLRDLRIIDSMGGEAPYKVLLEKEFSQSERRSVQIINNSFVLGEYTVFVADLGGAVLHNQIQILTPSKNFRQEVTIEGSHDQNQWFILTDKGHVYDYSPPQFEFKKQSLAINYPESSYRYLRVKIFGRGEERVVVTGLEAYQTVRSVAKEVTYPAVIIEKGENTEAQATYVVIDLGSMGLPSSRLTIATPDINFSREVALEGSNDKTNWSIVEFRDAIFSFATPKFTGSKLSIDYLESTYRYFRLTIFNRDDKPITVPSVSSTGLLRKLVFNYDPAKEYKLYYGNSDARYPQYDIEALFLYLDLTQIPSVDLGAEAQNPFFEEVMPPQPPVTERLPWLLPLVLAFAAFILLGLIVRLVLSAKKSAK